MIFFELDTTATQTPPHHIIKISFPLLRLHIYSGDGNAVLFPPSFYIHFDSHSLTLLRQLSLHVHERQLLCLYRYLSVSMSSSYMFLFGRVGYFKG